MKYSKLRLLSLDDDKGEAYCGDGSSAFGLTGCTTGSVDGSSCTNGNGDLACWVGNSAELGSLFTYCSNGGDDNSQP